MDIYPLLLCPNLNLVKCKDDIYVHHNLQDHYFFFCDATNSKFIKNYDLICDVDECYLPIEIYKWNESNERVHYLTNIFHVQVNISSEMMSLFHEEDVEYETIANNFLLKQEIILNYLVFQDNFFFLNKYQKVVGNFFFLNELPILNLQISDLIKKPRRLIDDNKIYLFDVINIDCLINRCNYDIKMIEENITNFFKYFHPKKLTTTEIDKKNDKHELVPFTFLKKTIHEKSLLRNNIYKNNALIPFHKPVVTNKSRLKNNETNFKKKEKNKIDYNSYNLETSELRIVLITFGWNESQILPMFLDYYGNQVDKIIYFDNNSSDDSVEIINDWNQDNNNKVEVKYFETNNEIRDDLLTQNKNNIWKDYKDNYDWFIIVDTDEFLVPSQKYKFNIKNLITSIVEQQKYTTDSEIGGIGSVGYQMVHPRYNFHDIKKGTKCNKFDKVCCWNTKLLKEINYSPGCHNCDPEFITKNIKIMSGNNTMQLRHMKYVGNYDLILKRLLEYEKRLSEINKKNKWGTQYNINDFKKTYMLYSKKSIDITNF
jgi:hypothetical protein